MGANGRPRIKAYDSIAKACSICGNSFALRDRAFQSLAKFESRKFCSKACSDKGQLRDNRPSNFWSKVDVKGELDCWEWKGPLTHNGYGRTSINGQDTRCHRHAYAIIKGSIPGGLIIMHSCDNRRCCNPAHLSPGTAKDNWDDCVAKGRSPNSRVIMTDNMRQQIRSSAGTMRSIADQFGISAASVCRIRKSTI